MVVFDIMRLTKETPGTLDKEVAIFSIRREEDGIHPKNNLIIPEKIEDTVAIYYTKDSKHAHEQMDRFGIKFERQRYAKDDVGYKIELGGCSHYDLKEKFLNVLFTGFRLGESLCDVANIHGITFYQEFLKLKEETNPITYKDALGISNTEYIWNNYFLEMSKLSHHYKTSSLDLLFSKFKLFCDNKWDFVEGDATELKNNVLSNSKYSGLNLALNQKIGAHLDENYEIIDKLKWQVLELQVMELKI